MPNVIQRCRIGIKPVAAREAEPHNSLPAPSDVLASIDTVELFFRFPPKEVARLKAIQYPRVPWIEPCPDRDGRVWGHRLIVHQPTRKALLHLDRMQKQYRGKLCRFDLAVDFIATSPEHAQAIKKWLVGHMLLRWRRRAPMYDVKTTTYWIRQKGRKRRSNRDLAVYADRHSKVTGECDCCHLELKFYRAEAVKQTGYDSVKDLIDLNPSELLAKYVKFADLEAFYQKRIRLAVNEDRKQYQNKLTSAFTDRYRASLPRRIRGYLKRTMQDRVQWIRDHHPRLTLHPIENGNLNLPTKLEWGAIGDIDESRQTPVNSGIVMDDDLPRDSRKQYRVTRTPASFKPLRSGASAKSGVGDRGPLRTTPKATLLDSMTAPRRA